MPPKWETRRGTLSCSGLRVILINKHIRFELPKLESAGTNEIGKDDKEKVFQFYLFLVFQ